MDPQYKEYKNLLRDFQHLTEAFEVKLKNARKKHRKLEFSLEIANLDQKAAELRDVISIYEINMSEE